MSKAAIRLAFLVACWVPLCSASAGITRTWTGAVSTAFSEPRNWSPPGVPAADDSLYFFAATLDNDLPSGTAFGPLTFSGSVTLNGNAMMLTGNVTVAHAATFACNADLMIGAGLELGKDSSWEFPSPPGPRHYGSIDVNGQTLTIGGQGAVVKSLNGSGTVTVTGGPITVQEGGTFAGAFLGSIDIGGSMPNANLVSGWASVTGDGTLGNVDAIRISPGDDFRVGTLTTKSLELSGKSLFAAVAVFDLNVTGASDLIQATGTVGLGDPILIVNMAYGAPAAGQVFTLIDNQGPYRVGGGFRNLPEGTILTWNHYDYTLSYAGGDGNDVVLIAATPPKTWHGSINDLWSNPGNWWPNAIPVSGETLIFPHAGTMTNDLPAGFVLGPMRFENGVATLSGNPLTLTGDVTFQNGWAPLTCNADLKIGAAVKLGGNFLDDIRQDYGAIDVNGQTLTFPSKATAKSLNGSGTVILDRHAWITVSDGGAFNGTIFGGIKIHGSMPDAKVIHDSEFSSVGGDGTLGTVTASAIFPGRDFSCVAGTLKTRSLSIHGSRPSAYFRVYGTAGSDHIQVTGTVTLDSPILSVEIGCGSVAPGQHFLLIDNDGSDPISGRFAGVPEGALVRTHSLSGAAFFITYVGGDGNDVELFVPTTSSAALSQGGDTSLTGEPVALTAAITSEFGIPAGTVTFLENGVAIGSAPLSNGSATLNVSTLSVGSHTITATYSGGGGFVGAVSGPIVHTVVKGDTTTAIGAIHTPSFFGAVQFRISSAPRVPAAGKVAGTFTLREGRKVVANGPIDSGSGHVFLATLSVGTHTFVVSYSGSVTFKGSDSGSFVVEVTEAPTQITATSDVSTSATDGTVVLKIFVLPTTSAPLIVTGTVTISENGVVLSEQPTTGVLDVTLRLAGGHHVLSISYSGDANFLASSKEVEVDVKATPPVRRRGVRH